MGSHEIEVDEQFYGVLLALDRKEFNSDRKHRRHNPISLSNTDYDGEWMEDGTDILGDLIRVDGDKQLHAALTNLTHDQQALIKQVFFEGVTPSTIAQRDGVDKSAISHRLALAYKRLKKLLAE